MDNAQVIENFYTAFQNKDWQGMQQCYHPKVEFSDPVFTKLNSKQTKAMWHMLLAASTDLKITFDNIQTSDDKGYCHWEAKYTFSRTGRMVHNKIDAAFLFKDGLIIHHDDTFDLWSWSRMALGTSGALLGWTTFMKKKIQGMASQNLVKFIDKNPEYH